MPSQPQQILTAGDYLVLERQAETKSEYFAGEMFAMAGASRLHNLIVANIIRVLGNQLIDGLCNVYPSDMRVKMAKLNKYTYPDVVIACDEEFFEDEQGDTLLNPSVIIEVLSDSTEAYDRGKKFDHYQSLESFAEYILVTQDTYHLEHYVRQNDRTWTYTSFHSPEDVAQLASIRCILTLGDVYAKTGIPTLS
jgi:Uma2 family endonuclease